MDYEFQQTEFSKSILVSLFAGIIAVVICAFVNIVFRNYTSFPLSEFINISTIIFGICLISLVTGLVFYVLHHYIKKLGTLVFQLLTILITIGLLILTTYVNRSNYAPFNLEFKELLSTVIVITGLSFLLFIPYAFKRDLI